MPDVRGRLGLAISPQPSGFGPLLFAGRLEEGLEVAGTLGFSFVELSLRAAEDVDPDELARLLRRHALTLSAVATGQACLVDSLCLASPDPEVRAGAAGRLSRAVELAAPFGAAVIVGGIRGRLTGDPEAQAAQRAAALDAMAGCAGRAARHGVTLLVEPINRYETNFVNTAAEALAVVAEVGEPAFKLLLDTFHMNIEERRLPEAVALAGTRLGYVHLADSNRQAPGQGHTDFGAVVRALEEAGYRGPLVAEILPVPDDAGAARLTAEYFGLGEGPAR